MTFPAATPEASVFGCKWPPANEGTPSTKRRDAEEGTSPEGIVYHAFSLKLVRLTGIMRVCVDPISNLTTTGWKLRR